MYNQTSDIDLPCPPTSVAVSESGRLNAIGHADGSVTVCSKARSICVEAHNGAVNGVAFSTIEFGSLMVTGGSDGKVIVQSVESALASSDVEPVSHQQMMGMPQQMPQQQMMGMSQQMPQQQMMGMPQQMPQQQMMGMPQQQMMGMPQQMPQQQMMGMPQQMPQQQMMGMQQSGMTMGTKPNVPTKKQGDVLYVTQFDMPVKSVDCCIDARGCLGNDPNLPLSHPAGLWIAAGLADGTVRVLYITKESRWETVSSFSLADSPIDYVQWGSLYNTNDSGPGRMIVAASKTAIYALSVTLSIPPIPVGGNMVNDPMVNSPFNRIDSPQPQSNLSEGHALAHGTLNVISRYSCPVGPIAMRTEGVPSLAIRTPATIQADANGGSMIKPTEIIYLSLPSLELVKSEPDATSSNNVCSLAFRGDQLFGAGTGAGEVYPL